MNNTMYMTALTLALIAGSAQADGYQAGLIDMAIEDAQTQRPLTGSIWYPAEAGSQTARVQSNAVWAGVDAAQDADLAEGTYPLLVLSHGMYGNMMNQNWLAAEMARDGYIVITLNHPGTSTWLRDPNDARQLWERPRDISRTITYALERSDFADNIDAARIYMAGHSLGGWTAMELAGARYNPARLEAICASGADPLVCGIMDRWQVGKTEADRIALAQDYSDPRISSFAVFDLGGTQTLDVGSLGAIEGNFLIMGAPLAGSDIDLDLESRDLVAKMTSATVNYIEPDTFSHFDFMSICTPNALAILEEEEPEDVIVCEGGIQERKDDHARIIAAVQAHFEAN